MNANEDCVRAAEQQRNNLTYDTALRNKYIR